MQHPPKAAVLGYPINHSLSPRLHGFWLHTYNVAGSYEAIPVPPPDFPAYLRALPTHGLCGVNLTVPHKETACTLVDTLDATAQRIGAVNLVTVDAQGKVHGRNTDAFGFTQNLLINGYQPNNGTALVLGAGGAARAVIVALTDMGLTNIRIANRTAERAHKLAREFSTPTCTITEIDWTTAPHALNDIELLVNTTSLGMTGQPNLDLPLADLSPTAIVTDIVYAPLETSLLRQAKLRGNKTIDGLGMLLHQARPAFAAFFGHDPEVTDELRRAVLAGRT